MGTSGALAGPNFQITAAMGRQIGPNLFHSFGTFNLVNGESATFSGPAGIQNIFGAHHGRQRVVDRWHDQFVHRGRESLFC